MAAFAFGGGAGLPEIQASTRVDQLMDATCLIAEGVRRLEDGAPPQQVMSAVKDMQCRAVEEKKRPESRLRQKAKGKERLKSGTCSRKAKS